MQGDGAARGVFFSTDMGQSEKTGNDDVTLLGSDDVTLLKEGRVLCRRLFTTDDSRVLLQVERVGREASCFCLGEGRLLSLRMEKGLAWRCRIC